MFRMVTSTTPTAPQSTWGTVKLVFDVCGSIALMLVAITITIEHFRSGTSTIVPSTSVRGPAPAPPTALQEFPGRNMTGRPTAHVGIIEYSDFQCPFCGSWAINVWPRLLDRYVTAGTVAWEFRHFPLESLHPNARRAAELAECAAIDGHFWQLHDALFANQNDLTAAGLPALAIRSGMRASAVQACASKTFDTAIRSDIESAKKLGISATPTFLVGLVEQGGLRVKQIIVGTRTIDELAAVIDPLSQSR